MEDVDLVPAKLVGVGKTVHDDFAQGIDGDLWCSLSASNIWEGTFEEFSFVNIDGWQAFGWHAVNSTPKAENVIASIFDREGGFDPFGAKADSLLASLSNTSEQRS